MVEEMVTPSKQNEKKIYDTADLINVLESNNNVTERKVSMPPKKRKLPEEPSPKKKLRFWRPEQEIYIEPKWITCRQLPPLKKRHVRKKYEPKFVAKTTVPQVLHDSVTLRNIVVKREIVDLTQEENSVFAHLYFADSNEISDETVIFDDCSPQKARIVVCDPSGEIELSVPDVRQHTGEIYVDLTCNESDTGEKECADRILPLLLKFHRIYQANKKIGDALWEIHDCFSAEEAIEDHSLTVIHMTKRTTSVGLSLIEVLSRMVVRNLDLSRLLETIASQFEEKVKVETLGLYLYSMLHQNRAVCEGSLTKELLARLETYVSNLRTKEVKEGEVVFTPEQLDQLRGQIEQYLVIVLRQEQLMAQYFLENDLSYGNFEERIKCEVDRVNGENWIFDIA